MLCGQKLLTAECAKNSREGRREKQRAHHCPKSPFWQGPSGVSVSTDETCWGLRLSLRLLNMRYKALLFCPDEKMARTVTQVLSELDFTVVPCTEPFAAVKKLMGEHFDAVVVDCDNEQNATLLFKSARNTVLNQSSLAVAEVEGQAGVAKAFRIGANLVLTKPINVEQAKGTLRVARGLLRKSEGAKPAAAGVSSTIKHTAAAPPKLVLQRPVPSAPAAPAALPMATASAATKKPTSQPSVVASAPIVASIPIESESEVDIFDLSEETASDSIAKP